MVKNAIFTRKPIIKILPSKLDSEHFNKMVTLQSLLAFIKGGKSAIPKQILAEKIFFLQNSIEYHQYHL